MRIAALVSHPEHVCARYRVTAFRPHLEQAGHPLTLVAWPRFLASRLFFDRRLREADVIVVQRRLLSSWQMFLLRRLGKRIWFDFDDAVFLRDSYHPRGPVSRRLERGFARMMRACEFVLAGNRFLAENAARWIDARQVRVVPTCVDVTRYQPAQHALQGRLPTLVWIGSSSTWQGIELVRRELERLGERNPGLRLRVVCDRAPDFERLAIDFCRWSEASEAADLAGADIGVSWIPDDDWSRGKCGLKVLQYMAAGLPVAANAVGVHPEMIEHERTGLLAQTPRAWADALERLIRDPDLRRRLGQAGRRRVEANYHVTQGAAQWLELLERPTPLRLSA